MPKVLMTTGHWWRNVVHIMSDVNRQDLRMNAYTMLMLVCITSFHITMKPSCILELLVDKLRKNMPEYRIT